MIRWRRLGSWGWLIRVEPVIGGFFVVKGLSVVNEISVVNGLSVVNEISVVNGLSVVSGLAPRWAAKQPQSASPRFIR